MEGNNIDLFNKFCGELLSNLYESFPVERDISLTDFRYLDDEKNSDIFFSSLQFLNKEGFIDYREAVYGAFIGVSLTTKSLSLLNLVLSSLQTNATFGKELKTVVREGKSEVVKKLIGELFKLSLESFS